MPRYSCIFFVALWLAVPARADPAADPQKAAAAIGALGWVKGPAQVTITDHAGLALPANDMYLGPDDTAKLLKLTGNPPGDQLYTVAARDFHWFSIFGFDASGYVKDDEQIDGAALLKSLQDAQTADNEQRSKLGYDALTVTGWSVAPHYDAASHNLEWGTRLSSPGGENVNYTVRLLGRHGVTSATLVTDPQHLGSDLTAFRSTLAGFHYRPDETYEAYRSGDKVAEYGLAALITGGAAAAAVKVGAAKGLLALGIAFFKYIAAGAVALFAVVRRFFSRRSAGGE